MLAVVAGLAGVDLLQHQAVDVAGIYFPHRLRRRSEFAHVAECVAVADRFEVVFQRLAADGNFFCRTAI